MMDIREELLSENIFSRPGKKLDSVMALVVHYLGKAGQGPMGARNYWEGLKTQSDADDRPDISASAHYIIGFKGEIIRTIPEDEKAYHCGGATYTKAAQEYFGRYCTNQNSPNRVTIGIELCHALASGEPSIVTRSSARELLRFLCNKYGLEPKRDIWRHADITGKPCPLWYVTYPEDWKAFIDSI
jgi:N-acetylmuramoyl-L-alanine amidase